MSLRLPRALGARRWQRRDAGRSRARLPCAPMRLRGPARWREASGRCAAAGIARRRISYSAWIERLFEAPIGEELSWPALHVGLRDKSRNDPVQPSRSWRRRDEDGAAPRLRRPAVFPARLLCIQDGAAVRLLEMHARRRRPRTILRRLCEHSGCRAAGRTASRRRAPLRPRRLQLRRSRRGSPRRSANTRKAIGDAVHSGSARTALADNNTDYYPVSLSQETLRPGRSTPIPTDTSWCW